jgi:hypothetical protein
MYLLETTFLQNVAEANLKILNIKIRLKMRTEMAALADIVKEWLQNPVL